MVTNPPAFDSASKPTTAAVLLVLTAFEENAKRIESHLLNAGHKVRTIWLASASALEQELQRTTADLLIASIQIEDAPLRKVVETCRRFAPHLPVLGLAAELSGEETMKALMAGARDLVADAGGPESLSHLERVYLRESVSHRNQRELARARSLLADYESRYTSLLEGTGDAVAHIYEGILSQSNPAFAALLGYEDDAELVSLPVMDVVAPEDQGLVRDHLKRINKGEADGEALDFRLQGREGNAVPVSALMTRGEAEGEQFIELLIRAEAARSDSAVALSGRADFLRAIEQAASSQPPCAALYIKVDHGEQLEERVGLIDAESLISQLGQAAQKRLNSRDSLYSLGSTEFGALVSRSDAEAFEPLAQKLVRDLGAEVYTASEAESQLTVSVSIYPVGDADPASKVLADLVRETRRLSDQVGNAAQVLGPTAKANAEEVADARKAEGIRKAIEENRLKLAYQTIASLEGDSRQHFDVLVRLINEEGVELHASDFIRAAERNGLMRSIDRWVVARAMKVLSERPARDDNAMLFLKLSEDTLKDAEAFLAWFGEITKGQKLANEEVCFEMQEVVAQNHIRKAKLICKALRDANASVALEHFGIGTQSSRMVEHLPVNFLKFHSSFTNKFDDKQTQKKMVELMEVAKQKHIKTIVSHVEDANVMARMWQMGVNYIQGYHIQEPEVVLLS